MPISLQSNQEQVTNHLKIQAMRITDPILGNYVIDVTENSFTLREIKVKKGKNTESTVGYFTTLEGAINKLIKRKLLTRDSVISLTDFIQIYKEESDKIKSVLQNMLVLA